MLRRTHPLVSLLCLIIFLFIPVTGHAQPPDNILIPIGGSYETDTLTAVVAQTLTRDTDTIVTIRALPIAYASDPFVITPGERSANLADAQARADEILTICNNLVSPPSSCVVTVPDIQVQSDANNPVLVNTTLDSSVDGIFILGGDQTIAMQVVANTLAESALTTLYNDGVPISGTNAGAGVQSRYMIAGYTTGNEAANGLQFGAVDIWYGDLTSSERGLSFGLDSAVIEQHTLEQGRLARLLQATQRLTETVPHVGFGLDWGTTAEIDNQQVISNVIGAYAGVVVDEESYNAAATAVYTGSAQLLSIHNVAFHVLPPGPYGYNLTNRHPIVNGIPDPTQPDIAARNFDLLVGPPGSGTLFIAGDLGTAPTGTVVTRFAVLAQATGQSTVVLATGYGSDIMANNAANFWHDQLVALGVTNVLPRALVDSSDLGVLAAELSAAGAIFVVGNNQQRMATRVDELTTINLAQLWQTGRVMLLDNAAAAVAGTWISAELTPTAGNLEVQSSETFLTGNVDIQPGLGLIPGTVFEPRLLTDYRYGRLVNHIHQHNNLVTLGIERNTALEITPSQVTVIGEGPVMVIDGRFSPHIGTGSNNAIAATWLLVDTYAPGEPLVTASPTSIHLAHFGVISSFSTLWVWFALFSTLVLGVLLLCNFSKHFLPCLPSNHK